jgi:hypothetical protein
VDWVSGSPSRNGLGAAAIEVEATACFEAAAFGGVGMRNAFGEVLGAREEGTGRWGGNGCRNLVEEVGAEAEERVLPGL